MTETERGTEKGFGQFLKEYRLRHGITLEQLSDGLCSASGLARIEGGERTVGKVLRDRLLYRLGVSPDTYEHFLFEEDYTRWKKRQQLLYTVARRETEEAGRRLREYRMQYEEGAKTDVDRRLERQFCLSMEGQILQSEAEESAGQILQERLGDLYWEALRLTVKLPDLPAAVQRTSGQQMPSASRSIRDKICSVQELNLLLEALRYGCPRDRGMLYEEILCLIEDSRFDKVSRAKIYSKAVYYFCLDGTARGTWGLEEKAEAIARCGNALEVLRKVGRMYYLWELLERV